MNLLDGVRAAFKRMSRAAEPFDPAVFSDPLAQRISWEPAAPGGANFCTRRLAPMRGGPVARFNATLGLTLFSLVFLLTGLGALAAWVDAYASGASHEGAWILCFVGGLFALVGGFLLKKSREPIVFDKAVYEYRGGSDRVPLGRIRALQILCELVRSDKSTYCSYELNLVLDDATRVNVVDHGNGDTLRADARALGVFLGVPVWDSQHPGG